MTTDWFTIERGKAPLIVSIPHAGTDIPEEVAERLISLPLARYDADLHVDRLYAFARELDATIVRTAISRTVIDVNRDPSGQSLYPGQTTTGLCPTTTFDGDPLYRDGAEPDEAEIARRRERWFAPYHDALVDEIARLRQQHPAIVLYEAHSIRSHVPRLFDGELPHFNIGTNSGAACSARLTEAVEAICDASGRSRITDGRFKGGWTTRHYGVSAEGVHAIQMELSMRGYIEEVASEQWPPPWNERLAGECQAILRPILTTCIDFARGHA